MGHCAPRRSAHGAEYAADQAAELQSRRRRLYITKPFEVEELLAHISALLNHSRSSRRTSIDGYRHHVDEVDVRAGKEVDSKYHRVDKNRLLPVRPVTLSA